MHAVVLGLARSGAAAARALLDAGATVTALDAADGPEQQAAAASVPGAIALLGRTDGADVDGADLVVTSPGVAPSSVWIKAAEAAGIPVWSEIELAYRLGARPLVAITGTNGKTTTTEMVTAALLADGRRAVSAGNIGHALIQTLGGSHDAVVAEVSSFQLHGTDRFRAPVAVLLNIARDHLDWHGGHEAYAAAKARLFHNQGSEDFAIYHEDPACRAALNGAGARVPFDEEALPDGGAGIEAGWIVVPRGRVVKVGALQVRGRPHRADAVAAAAAAAAAGADLEAIGEALAAYQPRPHRIEIVAIIDGVTYINDSKATDPHATLAALEELDRVVLIAGGRNKGLDFEELTAAAPRLRAVIAMGESATEIVAAFEGTAVAVETAGDMDDAVVRARRLTGSGDTVLLSPACASFDMFNGYEARGEAFREAVARLGEESR